MAKRGQRRPESRRSEPRVITAEDLLRFHWVSSPRMSPNGEHVVFVKKCIGKKNDAVTELWIADSTGKETRRFTAGPKDSTPSWSPSGSHIAFVRESEEGAPQIYSIDVAGGEANVLTRFPEGLLSDVRWAPNGKCLAVSFREQDPEWTNRAKRDRDEAGLSPPPRVLDDWWYRLDGDGYFNAQRYQLFVVDADTGCHRKLYGRDTLGSFTFDFSPDSKRIVVSTNRAKRALVEDWRDELIVVDVATGRVNPIPLLPPGPKSCVRWSPDGKTIAYVGCDGGKELLGYENRNLWVCDPQKGRARNLTGDLDLCLVAVSVSDSAEAVFAPQVEFSPDSARIFFRLGKHGESQIASIPRDGGSITVHTRGALDHDLGSFSRDGKKLALLVGSPTKLHEVGVLTVSRTGGRTATITRLNDALFGELGLAEPETHWIHAEDGHPVQLWVLKPRQLPKRRGRAPAVLEIHGGPQAQYGSGFFLEFQLLAANGYAVFYSNPRGSKGYGQDHCAAICGAWGDADWKDIQAVVKHMKNQPFVDAARLGIMGGSYGGYMTNWAIGHCHDFRAAITDRCVSNVVTLSGTSDFVIEPDRYFPGNFWDRPDARWDQSPIQYVGNVKTPTLIIHSEGDLRCNIEQADQWFMALKILKVPTRFVRYPASTSHGLSRSGPADLRIHRLKQILAWWKKYLA